MAKAISVDLNFNPRLVKVRSARLAMVGPKAVELMTFLPCRFRD
jgi:hypothetical protein